MPRNPEPFTIPKFGQEIDNLNNFAIKLKKLLHEGKLDSITVEEIDQATLPAIYALDSIREDPRKY